MGSNDHLPIEQQFGTGPELTACKDCIFHVLVNPALDPQHDCVAPAPTWRKFVPLDGTWKLVPVPIATVNTDGHCPHFEEKP